MNRNPTNAQKKLGNVILAAVALFILLVVLINVFGSKDDSNTPGKAKNTYKSKVISHKVQDPATLFVVIEVNNKGSNPGQPVCTVTADNGTSEYKGFGSYKVPSEISAGDIGYLNANVTITNQGAEYANNIKVECAE